MKQITDHKEQYDAAMKRVDRIIAELDEELARIDHQEVRHESHQN